MALIHASDSNYDKLVCMNSATITEMNYIMGAHLARPEVLAKYIERHYAKTEAQIRKEFAKAVTLAKSLQEYQ